MRRFRPWNPGRRIALRSLTASLLLGLSFASVEEIHTASHRPPVSYTDLAAEFAVPHPSKPAHFRTALGVSDLRCLVCLLSAQQRGPDTDRPVALPQPLSASAPPVDDLLIVPALLGQLPVSRGPPPA